ncbi:hypothetical protein C900_01556 [Fulvivirga imtechensis AK7]|uniref:Uncharacterized protein n=1 Tax=Fulvivirga imtechensis AK7 TaxID=1237149 RepID=L8JUE4_9BACT|nr:hypothetical protein C900_01556 [Fulvivirga imtechensis AK7]
MTSQVPNFFTWILDEHNLRIRLIELKKEIAERRVECTTSLTPINPD